MLNFRYSTPPGGLFTTPNFDTYTFQKMKNVIKPREIRTFFVSKNKAGHFSGQFYILSPVIVDRNKSTFITLRINNMTLKIGNSLAASKLGLNLKKFTIRF